MALGDFRLDVSRLTSLSRAYSLPCPSPGDWALAEEACRFVGAFVQWYEPGHVLEFGSGFSSLVISSELARHERGVLDSIDNSPRWNVTARELAREHGLLKRIEFHRFPLGLRVYGRVPCVFYKIPSAFYERRAPYDLVIVDGPHHDVSRDGALPESFARLRTGGYLLLDDCHSDHMQRTLAKWKVLFGSSIACAGVLDIGNGIGIMRKLTKGPSWPVSLPPHWLLWEWLRTIRNLWRTRRLGLNRE